MINALYNAKKFSVPLMTTNSACVESNFRHPTPSTMLPR